MRVLHINCNYITSDLHEQLKKHLDKLGISNSVFVPTYYNNKCKHFYDKDITISHCFPKISRFFFYYKQSKIISTCENCYQIPNFDIIHAYTLFTDGNCAYELFKKYKLPYIVTIRNTDINIFFKYFLYLRKRGIEILKNAKTIIFLSEAYRIELFSKYIPCSLRDELSKKVRIIPNGINPIWINTSRSHIVKKNKDFKIECIQLLYVGRINKNKNILSIQRSIKHLNQMGYRAKLTIVGKIEDNNLFCKIIKDKNTFYLEEKDIHDLLLIYPQFDIFVMPSYTESFGLVYAEAMSRGVPVIYSKGQGFDMQFNEGEVGFHVDPYCPKDIAKKIILIISNYYNICSNCVDLCIKFDWNNISQQYHNIYYDINKIIDK